MVNTKEDMSKNTDVAHRQYFLGTYHVNTLLKKSTFCQGSKNTNFT